MCYCTNQQPPQRDGAVPDPVWVGSKWLLDFPRIPVNPGIPLHFFAMLPPERLQKGSTQLLQNRSPVFSFLLPVFVSLFFSCSLCAGNVTWRGKSARCCTCSKLVHLRCSQLSLTKFRTLDSSHSWSFPS